MYINQHRAMEFEPLQTCRNVLILPALPLANSPCQFRLHILAAEFASIWKLPES